MRVLYIIALLVLTTSCKKNLEGAEVVRDCTGTYLRIDDEDFKVCNDEILDDYTEGASVNVRYKKVQDCEDDGAVCMLYHRYSASIEITEVK
jgi:hypothetical protein